MRPDAEYSSFAVDVAAPGAGLTIGDLLRFESDEIGDLYGHSTPRTRFASRAAAEAAAAITRSRWPNHEVEVNGKLYS